ncbi:unnamed protein product, partial [Candidula unifasciata]
MSSPVKAAREGPSIMDVEFNEEDDDDDEYNPEKDEEFPESDDESITSSKLSEFGSPYRDFSSTPIRTPSRDRVAASTATKEVTSDAVAESDLPNTSYTSVDNIALRTRSKQSLTSTSITEIESNFVAPDITTDMYDNYCDEPDYVQFLSTLNKPTDDPMTDDDADANDPEYNYNFEAEKEQSDEEDFRWDKLSKISMKEVDTLVEELYEYYKNDMLPLPYQVVASATEVTGSWKMWPGSQEMPSSSQDDHHAVSQPAPSSVPTEATTASLPMPTTSLSSLNSSGVSQPESSDPLSKFKTPLPPSGSSPQRPPPLRVPPPPPSSPHLTHITSNNSEPSQPEEQPNAFTTSDTKSASNTDTNAFVTPEQRALIEDNIRKHIQLLLQSYLLCQNVPSLELEVTDAKCMIVELNYFRECSCVGGASTFSVYNLDPALEVLSTPPVAENVKLVNHVEGEPVCRLSPTQKLTVLNSPAFVYPHLLPRLNRPQKNERKYKKFFPSEDKLIAVGMEQFQKCKDLRSSELLHQLLIRGKSLKAIHNRIHFNCSRKMGDNAIRSVRKTGKLPESFPKPSTDYFYTMAPKYQLPDLLPSWCSLTNIWSRRGNLMRLTDSHYLAYQLLKLSLKHMKTFRKKKQRLKNFRKKKLASVKLWKQIPYLIRIPSMRNDFHGGIDGTSQSLFSSETTVISEPRSCLASSVHHSEPHRHGEHQKEEARIGKASQTNTLPNSDSSSVSNQDQLCDISKCPTASTRNNFHGGTDRTSQSIFSSDLPLASDMVNVEIKKQALAVGDKKGSQELELPIEDKFNDLSSQSRLMVDNTFQSQTEREALVDSELASDCSVQNDNRTCETVNGGQSAESGIDLSPQNDKNSLQNAAETREVLQDDRAVQSDINLTAKDDNEAFNNVTESDSTLTENIILPVLTDDSSSSSDKTLICASGSISDSADSNKADSIERKSNTSELQQAQRKPKTIRQILEAAEKGKLCTATNTSVLTPDGDSVISDIVNKNTDSAIRTSENTKVNQPVKGVTATNVSSESSKCVQQENTSPLSQCCSITTPTPSINFINLQSPVTLPHSSSQNTKANQPTQDVTIISNSGESSTCVQQENTSPLSQCCSVTTPTPVALINLQSPVKSHSVRNFKFPSPFKTPTKLHPLLPKTPFSAASVSSPYIPLPKTSPRRKELNKHVRQILPKSFVFEMKSPSPTKTAAQMLKKKATLFCQSRSPVKLLPKPPQTALSGSKPLLTPTRMFTRSQKSKGKNTGINLYPQPGKEKAIVEPAAMETDDAVLSQEEEEEGFESDDQSQLDDLMAACTTIGYDPKKGSSGTDNDNKSKAQKKKDVCLSMLEPDIIDRDAKKDERDTAYAQHYFTHIKQVLGDDAERFKKFLTILHDMNRNHMSPVE